MSAPDTAAAAQALLASDADAGVVQAVERILAEGGRWIPDPQVRWVWALLDASDEVLVVCYLPGEDVWGQPRPLGDFEISWEGEKRLAAMGF